MKMPNTDLPREGFWYGIIKYPSDGGNFDNDSNEGGHCLDCNLKGFRCGLRLGVKWNLLSNFNEGRTKMKIKFSISIIFLIAAFGCISNPKIFENQSNETKFSD